MIKSSKAKFLPKLNAFGSFEMYDNKIAQFNANGYLVGIQLSWNVFDGLKSNLNRKNTNPNSIKPKPKSSNIPNKVSWNSTKR
jgi:outer membrane protein TolC